VCYWCRSIGPHDFPCCVPALFWQNNVQESARQLLAERADWVGLLDLDHHPFVPPDNPPDNVEE
jgi:hypothetical protein